MALDKTTLKTAIKTAFLTRLGDSTSEQEAEIDALATDLSEAMEAFVKSGVVTVASGIAVATTGTATAQAGATTATGTGTIA